MEREDIFLFKFFKKMNVNTVSYSAYLYQGEIEDFDDYIHINDRYNTIQVRPPLEGYLEKVIDKYVDQIFSQSPDNEDATGYAKITCEIRPNEEKYVFYLEEQVMTSEDDHYSADLNDRPDFKKVIDELFESLGYEGDIIIEYNGGGDNGYLEKNMILEDLSGDNEFEVPDNLQSIMYEYLHYAFPGWEINDGSEGNIRFNSDELSVQHRWYTDEYIETLNIEIKP